MAPLVVLLALLTQTTAPARPVEGFAPYEGARFAWGDDHRLTIHRAAKHAELPNCSVSPTPDEQTVILISTAARPRP